MHFREIGSEVDGTGSGLYAMSGFGMNRIELSGFAA
jgi:hypothetical protein